MCISSLFNLRELSFCFPPVSIFKTFQLSGILSPSHTCEIVFMAGLCICRGCDEDWEGKRGWDCLCGANCFVEGVSGYDWMHSCAGVFFCGGKEVLGCLSSMRRFWSWWELFQGWKRLIFVVMARWRRGR